MKPRLCVVLALAALLTGCQTGPAAPARATATAPSGLTVSQSGAALVPATATAKDDARTVQIPAGTVAEFNDKLGTLRLTFSAASVLTQTVKTESVTAPQSFTPPAPPSPAEIADGRAVLWYRVGVVLGIAAGLFGLVRAWDFVMWGGLTVAAACLAGLFIQSHPILILFLGVGAALMVAGPALWHLKLKDLPASK